MCLPVKVFRTSNSYQAICISQLAEDSNFVATRGEWNVKKVAPKHTCFRSSDGLPCSSQSERVTRRARQSLRVSRLSCSGGAMFRFFSFRKSYKRQSETLKLYEDFDHMLMIRRTDNRKRRKRTGQHLWVLSWTVVLLVLDYGAMSIRG